MVDFADKRTAIIAAAAISSVATLLTSGAVYGIYTSIKRSKKVRSVKREAREATPESTTWALSRNLEYSQELIDEQLARNRAFLGDRGNQAIRDAFVIVVGAGGVGSWAATMLVRSGVKKLRIIDFDQVTLSSLNRHACATLEDVGLAKVDCCANYLSKVAPFVEIEPVTALWTLDRAKDLLHGEPTYVVDCIDNIDTKVDLLDYCVKELKCKVISAMGAGCKADPTRIRLGDISMSIEDPLSRSVRRRLKLKGITSGVPVVFSSEKPGKDKAKLLELEESEVEKGQVNELSVLQDFRVRILPVLGPLPGIFGLTIATHILNDLGGYSPVFDPLQGGYSMAGKVRTKLYENAIQSLVGQATRMGWPESRKPPLDAVDAGYIIEEVFRGKSPVSGESNRLVLSCWDPSKPVRVGNLVPMTKEQQEFHEKNVLKLGEQGTAKIKDVYSPEVLQIVEKRFEEDTWYEQFR